MSINQDSPSLQDFFKTFPQRFTTIKIDEPNRANCNWYVGLTDNENQFKNSFKCKTINDAESLIEHILSYKYDNVLRGDDYGNSSFRTIVYLYGVER